MESNEPATAENRDFHCFDAAGSAGSLLTKRSIRALGRMHTIIVKFKIRAHRSRCAVFWETWATTSPTP